MAKTNELIDLLRNNSPATILNNFKGRTKELRRLLRTRRLYQQLALERDISAAMCAQQVFAHTSHALTRLTDMIDFAPHEPGRKAAEALLSHGMRLQKSFDRDATRRPPPQANLAAPPAQATQRSHARSRRLTPARQGPSH